MTPTPPVPDASAGPGRVADTTGDFWKGRVAASGGDGVLPFTVLKPVAWQPHKVCRGTAQRARRREAVQQAAANTVEALNSLAGFSSPMVDRMAELGAESLQLHRRLFDMYSRMWKGKPQVTPHEAFRELLGCKSSAYGMEAEQTTVRPYDKGKVSWPERGGAAVSLETSAPAEVRRLIEGPSTAWLWQDDEFKNKVNERPLPQLYMDERLKTEPEAYSDFIRECADRGMMRYGKRAREKVKVFFVDKKGDKLRIIFDCRRVNRRFKPPPGVRLFSGGGFAEVQVEPGHKLYFAGCDVKNAFYDHGLPEWLSDFFLLAYGEGRCCGDHIGGGKSSSTNNLGLPPARCGADGMVLGRVDRATGSRKYLDERS